MHEIVIRITVPDGCKINVSQEPVSEPKKPEEVPTPVAEPQNSEAAEAKAKVEAVKVALLAAIDRVGKTKGLARLKEFGVNRVSELSPEKYDEVIASFETLVA